MNEGEATKLCLICPFSVMHVLRPNRVVAYTLVRGQNPFANGYLNSPIGSLCDGVQPLHIGRVRE